MKTAHLAVSGAGLLPPGALMLKLLLIGVPQSGADAVLPPVVLRNCTAGMLYALLPALLLLPLTGSGCPRGSRNFTAASLNSTLFPPSRLQEPKTPGLPRGGSGGSCCPALPLLLRPEPLGAVLAPVHGREHQNKHQAVGVGHWD